MENQEIQFYYKALNGEGLVVSGYQLAVDDFDLQHKLKNEKLVLLSARPIFKLSFRNLIFKISNFGTISEKEKIIFIKNLGSMLGSGLSLIRAIKVLQKQNQNTKLKKILKTIESNLEKGSALSKTLAIFPKIFPKIVVSMIASGEEIGNLSKALETVGDQMEKNYLLRKKIQGAMIYPAVIILAMIIIGILMLVYVVPVLVFSFQELKIELPGITMMVIGLSEFINQNLVWVLTGLILFIFSFYFFFRSVSGRKILDWVLIRIPGFSSLVKEIYSARTARTLSSLISAGISMNHAIDITKDVIGNSYYKKVLEEARVNVEVGKPISGVFSKYDKLYPLYISEMMAVGEETGELGGMLLEVAVFYEKEIEQKTKNIATLVEPILMLIVGTMVGFFAYSMIAPMYTLVENI